MLMVELNGIAQLISNNALLGVTTHSRVERSLVKELQEKVFPEESQRRAGNPAMPGVYQIHALNALARLAVTLIDAEAQILLRALEQFEQTVGITLEQGEWFDPLVDKLKG